MEKKFKEAAKQYRIARRLWEVEVVRHEFLARHNYGIFRPGTTKTAVQRTIRMGKADIVKDC